jgi:alanine dehydrogenase
MLIGEPLETVDGENCVAFMPGTAEKFTARGGR